MAAEEGASGLNFDPERLHNIPHNCTFGSRSIFGFGNVHISASYWATAALLWTIHTSRKNEPFIAGASRRGWSRSVILTYTACITTAALLCIIYCGSFARSDTTHLMTAALCITEDCAESSAAALCIMTSCRIDRSCIFDRGARACSRCRWPRSAAAAASQWPLLLGAQIW